jgi:hypothetical protein
MFAIALPNHVTLTVYREAVSSKSAYGKVGISVAGCVVYAYTKTPQSGRVD